MVFLWTLKANPRHAISASALNERRNARPPPQRSGIEEVSTTLILVFVPILLEVRIIHDSHCRILYAKKKKKKDPLASWIDICQQGSTSCSQASQSIEHSERRGNPPPYSARTGALLDVAYLPQVVHDHQGTAAERTRTTRRPQTAPGTRADQDRREQDGQDLRLLCRSGLDSKLGCVALVSVAQTFFPLFLLAFNLPSCLYISFSHRKKNLISHASDALPTPNSSSPLLSFSHAQEADQIQRTMSSPTTKDESGLERCLALLRPGTSDESKFIGLTLMSDLLQSTQDLDTMTQFFDSMDFAFLDRMMQTGMEERVKEGEWRKATHDRSGYSRAICTTNYFAPRGFADEDSIPKDAGVDAAAIRSISVDILSCFSTHWELLVRKEFKERIPVMLSMLSPR